jgi:hypothetical protein
MRQDGFLPLLENNLNLLGDAAAASLCIPLNHVLQSVSVHHWTGSSPEDAVAHINSLLSQQLGVSVFEFPKPSGINFAFI